MKPLWATASFHLTAAALLARLAGHKRVAGWLLLLVGFGFAGVEIERLCGDDVRALSHARWKTLNATQISAHALLTSLGAKWIRASR